MTELQYRQCRRCSVLRSWHKAVCPDCGNDSFETVVQQDTKIIEAATGETISETVLCESDVRMSEIEKSPLSGIVPQRLRSGVESRLPNRLTSQFRRDVQLEHRLCDYLEPDEQPEFLLYFQSRLKEDDGTERHKIESNSNDIPSELQPLFVDEGAFVGGLTLVTDLRLLILVEQEQGTVTRSIRYSDMTNIELRPIIEGTPVDQIISKIIYEWTHIEAETRSYEFRGWAPSSEVSPAIEYMSAQIEGKEFDEEAAYSKEGTVDSRVDSIIDQIDFKHVLQLGIEGMTTGSRGGPKGAAVGAVVGTGYGIFSSITGTSSNGVSELDPHSIGAAAAEWRQVGADMDDERAEWLAASLGVALHFAAHQSDREIDTLVQNINPETTTRLINKGLEATDSHSDLPTRQEEFELTLPESVQTWQAITADLIQNEGLLDELQAAHEKNSQ